MSETAKHRAHPQWRDWTWQMRHRVHDAATLRQYIHPIPDELAALDATKDVFRWNITPYYAALMDPDDPDCPIRRQMVPRMDELAPDLVGVVDPLEEVAHSPVKNLIHNYEDRVAFCVTAECAIYCRYCLRKRMVGDADFMMRKAELQQALDYLAAHTEIRDVLLTGGDPLTFSDRNLEWLLAHLRAIPHIELIRLGTRLPVTLPYRITDALCRMLERYHPLWLNTHFNHPKELTPDAAEGIDRLLRAGIPVGNQTVLLRGLNDNLATLKALLEGLVRMRVRPYYLYQAQLIGGTAHFRTSIEKGMELMHALQGHTSGFAIPRYVLDTPFGKVPLTRSYVQGRAGDYVVMETPRGTLWAEPNPLPPDEARTFTLPEMPLPEGIATIPLERMAEILPYAG
jgi:lysine 2,3-aminomutase